MSRVEQQYRRACNYLAGGVSSSTRLNRALGHAMLFDRAAGCRVWDLDDKEYLDLCCSHGATLLGHGDPRVRAAMQNALDRGAPIHLVQATLGHSSVATTGRYLHARPNDSSSRYLVV